MELTEFKEAIEANAKQIRSELDGMKLKLESGLTEISQKSENGFGLMTKATNNPIAALTKSDALRGFIADRSVKSAGVQLPGSIKTLVKGVVVGDVASSGNQLIGVPATFDSRLGEGGQRRLSIFDILPSLPVGSNSFEFNRLDGYSNAAAYQTNEAATKAAASMPTELVSAPICTIAHILPCSEQVLADMPALTQQVSNLLAYGVRAKAAAEIIGGSTSGKIQGLATEGATYTVSGSPNLPDAVASAISQLEQNGWQASAILMNPSDWLEVRTMRESSGTGAYLYGTPALTTAQTLWGVPVVVDPAVTEGSPIVMDASQVVILDRQQAMVEFGRQGTDFSDNIIRCRAEARLGLAVFSPSAVLVVNITT
jgi:HK97 family phage major capsid protein